MSVKREYAPRERGQSPRRAGDRPERCPEETSPETDTALADVSPLSALPFFNGLSERELRVVAQHMVRKKLERNAVIMSEGDRTDALYAISKGSVKVFLSNDDGDEVILSVHGAGAYFGEIALLDDAPRSASVMTLETTELLVISQVQWKRCLASNPEIALTVIRELTQRVRELTESVRRFALFDVYGRVIRTLTHLARQQGDKRVVAENLTQQDIANMVSASREMVNRILKDLEGDGYVTIKKRHIEILGKLPLELSCGR